jgi:hypothetical protein
VTPYAVFVSHEGEWWHFTVADPDDDEHRFKVDCDDFAWGWAAVARRIRLWTGE